MGLQPAAILSAGIFSPMLNISRYRWRYTGWVSLNKTPLYMAMSKTYIFGFLARSLLLACDDALSLSPDFGLSHLPGAGNWFSPSRTSSPNAQTRQVFDGAPA
eukprot:2872639-Rhodomonas_salina.2